MMYAFWPGLFGSENVTVHEVSVQNNYTVQENIQQTVGYVYIESDSHMNYSLSNSVFQSIAKKQESYAQAFAKRIAKRHYGIDDAQLYFLDMMGVYKINNDKFDRDFWVVGFRYAYPQTAVKNNGVLTFKYVFVALITNEKYVQRELSRDTIFNDHCYWMNRASVESNKCTLGTKYCYHANGEGWGTEEGYSFDIGSNSDSYYKENMWNFVKEFE